MFSTGKEKNPLLQTWYKCQVPDKVWDVWAMFNSKPFKKTVMCVAVCAFKLKMLNFQQEVLLFIGSLSTAFYTVAGLFSEAHLLSCIPPWFYAFILWFHCVHRAVFGKMLLFNVKHTISNWPAAAHTYVAYPCVVLMSLRYHFFCCCYWSQWWMVRCENDIMRNVRVFRFTFTTALISRLFSASVARWLNCIISLTVGWASCHVKNDCGIKPSSPQIVFFATKITIRIPVYVLITYLFKPYYASGSKGLDLSCGWIISGQTATIKKKPKNDCFSLTRSNVFLSLKFCLLNAARVFGTEATLNDCCSVKPFRKNCF